MICFIRLYRSTIAHMHPNVDWSVQRDRFRELVLRQLAKVGLHDLPQRIRFERVLTPADWDRSHEIHLGATFNLAHNLGLRVVAEGVETQEILDLLAILDCDVIQGYHLSKPLSAAEATQWLRPLQPEGKVRHIKDFR